MKLKIFALVVLFVISVESIPLSQIKLTPPILVTRDDYEKFAPIPLFSEPTLVNEESDEETVGYRLPNNSIPISYDLWLKTDVDKEIFEFDGHVKIHVKIVEETPSITLHIRQLEIKNIDIVATTGEILQDKASFGFQDQFEFLIVALPRIMLPDEEVILDITYQGTLREDDAGFYRAEYTNDETGKKVWYATTQFEMTDARHAMPCYDEPGIRATTKISIQHGKSYNAISNMPVTSRVDIEGTDYVTTTFDETIKMQTYLLAFVISDFTYKSNENTKTEQRVYAKPSLIEHGDGDFAVGVVDAVLRKLEEHYGIDYPLPKMDHAAITNFAFGAMENFGLITYRDSALLFDKEYDNIYKQKNIIELITHEYVHQYFGNIVSPKWWSYTWLNEGFATLYSTYIPHLIYPEEDYLNRFLIYTQQSAFSVDTVDNNATPLNYYPETPQEIRNKFSAIAYQKGGSFLRMFQESLTVPTFTRGLNYYLTEMYLKAATPQDLHRNLQKAYDEDFPGNELNLEKMMSTWEDQAGYPLITVTKTATAYTFTQSRFGGGDEIYSVPISFATSLEESFDVMTPKFWLTEPSFIWQNTENFIILNVRGIGYYKVSYDKSVLAPISEYLRYNSAKVPVLHREQLLTEMKTKLMSDSIEPVYALNMLFFLHSETQYSLWAEGTEIADFLFDKLFGTDIIDEFNHFIQSVVQFQVARLGFAAIDGDSSEDVNLRRVLTKMACQAHHEDCFAFETQRLAAHVQNPQGDIAISICNGLRRADETLHNYFINALLNSGSNYTEELGCPLDANLIKNYLNVVLDTTNILTDEQRIRVIESTASKSVIAFETVVDFLRENMLEIEKEIPGQMSRIILSLAGEVRSQVLQEKVTTLAFALSSGSLITLEDFLNVIRAADANVVWFVAYSNDIKTWLADSEITTTTSTTTTTTTTTSTTTTTTTTTTTAGPTTEGPSTEIPSTGGPTTAVSQTTTDGADSMIASLTLLVACAIFRVVF